MLLSKLPIQKLDVCILAEFACTIYPSGFERLIWQLFLLIVNEYWNTALIASSYNDLIDQ